MGPHDRSRPQGDSRARSIAAIQSFLMFKGLEHTAISSPNPQKLAEWYVEHLGFHINFTYAGNYFVKAANGSMLEIIPADRPLAAPQTVANNKDGGIRHLAIEIGSASCRER